MTVAMSTGGVYRTYDRGETWNPANAGIQVVFAADQFPEFGQCVHKIAAHPTRRTGSSRRTTAGSIAPTTAATSGPRSLMAYQMTSDSRSWCIHTGRKLYSSFRCLQTDRFPPEGKARVWRSDDAGESWTPSESGLPDHFYAAVLRDAMIADNAENMGLYVGARDGSSLLEHRRRCSLASDCRTFAGRAVRSRRSGLSPG